MKVPYFISSLPGKFRMVVAEVLGAPLYTRDILKGDDFDIGEYTYGIPHVVQPPGMKLTIGKFCSIAGEVTIQLGGNHSMNWVSTYPFSSFPDDWPGVSAFSYVRGENPEIDRQLEVRIGNDVWIGWGAHIMPGVTVGDGAVIGAKAVVTRDVEPYAIVAGNPARLIRKRFDEETIRRLLEIRWWDWPAEKIRRNLRIICTERISELS
jgi:acetyltransferase-like isoleucine patch superfamily enzyme